MKNLEKPGLHLEKKWKIFEDLQKNEKVVPKKQETTF